MLRQNPFPIYDGFKDALTGGLLQRLLLEQRHGIVAFILAMKSREIS
jgi:hypothetical protein